MQNNKTLEFKKEQLEKAMQYAIRKRGLCLSTQYIDFYYKLEWKCHNENHSSWYASYKSIVNREGWCPSCAKEKARELYTNKKGLNIAKEHAKNKLGECLSKEYINAKTKLEWKCHNNLHKNWFANFNAVVNNGTWCPECGKNRNIQENRVRNILNEIFNTTFISTKPSWNINPETKRRLELDGYSEKLNLAFEYQGEHHYLTSRFHTLDDLEYVKRKDAYKIENCKLNNTKLIIVKYIKKNNSFVDLLAEIKNSINQVGVNKNLNFDYKKLESLFNKTNINSLQEKQLQKAKEYAKVKSGECLSNEYINVKTKLTWKCNNSHIWKAEFNSTVNGNIWCPKCVGKFEKKEMLNKAKKYAKYKLGVCLSTNYINNKSKLEWKCGNTNHDIWFSTYDAIVNGEKWCPYCKSENSSNKQRLFNGLILAKEYAKSKNGECLSTEYINSKNKLIWKCDNNNHDIFYKSYFHAVKRTQWCPECYKERKKLK